MVLQIKLKDLFKLGYSLILMKYVDIIYEKNVNARH